MFVLIQSLKKGGRKDRYDEDDSIIQSNQKEDSCSMELEEDGWQECKLSEGEGYRTIWVTVVPPRKYQ